MSENTTEEEKTNIIETIKEQNPSRQRYYSAILGFVVGVVVTTLFFIF